MALAGVHARDGALETAEAAARAAVQQLAVTPPLQIGAYGQFVQILRVRGDLAAARSAAEAAMAKLQSLGGSGWMDLPLHLAVIEVELAVGATAAARSGLRAALATLRARAEQIDDADCRRHYLQEVTENARLVTLAEAYES